jgi:Fe-S cluster biogenesis protein NfuA
LEGASLVVLRRLEPGSAVFIVTEQTPNPNALKFVPDVALTDGASRWCTSADGSPLAARLFGLQGVRAVFIAPDFLTVTRAPDGPPRSDMRPSIIMAMADHLAAGEPVLGAAAVGETPLEDEVVADIRQVLGLHVRPGVSRDGGDVLLDRFDPATGVVWIRMHGACGGCPSSRMTLKAGVERILRRYVPEVERVEEVPPEPAEAARPRWAEWARTPAVDAPAKPQTLFTHKGRKIAKA